MAIGVEAFEWGLPHPCLFGSKRAPIPQIPVQAPLCTAYNLAAAAQSLCFPSKFPPNSLNIFLSYLFTAHAAMQHHWS